jgi:hypothetical protein
MTAAGHSTAFESFVGANDDLTGLVAYALYKQVIREKAAAGITTPSGHRQPTPTELDNYRNAAKGHLQRFAAEVTTAATPQIIAEALGTSIETAQVEVVKAIHRRTSFWSAIGTNLAAWVITLAITVLLLIGVYLPNWQSHLIEAIRAAQPPQERVTATSRP